MALDLQAIPPAKLLALRQMSVQGMEAARTYRWSWWTYWSLLAEMYIPQRYRWLITANNLSRGSPLNGQIVDETGLLAARTLANGLLSNLTSPTKQWFRLAIQGFDPKTEGPAQAWLADCTDKMLAVYAKSNFYNSQGTVFHDLVVFGSAAQIQYEDYKDVVRFYNPCLGEFFFGLNNRLEVSTLPREYTYTIQEACDEFGLANLSLPTQMAYKSGGASRQTEIVICHTISPNDEVYNDSTNFGLVVPASFPWREVYWEQASTAGGPSTVLRVSGFKEKPFVGYRWDVTSNDPYGRSPGMDALPAVRQLQIEQRRKAEGIDKLVRPPMVGSVSMKNEPSSILPGGITYTSDPTAGFKPAFQVEPRIQEMREDISEVQDRVRQIMFNPLFTGISDLDTVRSATEIDARVAEKLLMLGPVVERIESEGLDSTITRTFNIMMRRNLFLPPPQEISGRDIQIEYISLLAEAQRASKTASIERVVSFAGNIAGAFPEVLDNIDFDNTIDDYGDLLQAPSSMFRPQEQVDKMRADKAAQAQAQAMLAATDSIAKSAKVMSDTNVGGGQNALQAVTGGGGNQ